MRRPWWSSSLLLALPLLLSTASRAQQTAPMDLGSIRLSRDVFADGKPLKSGTYRVRLTPERVGSVSTGQGPESERWVEFLRGTTVAGREVVSVVSEAEIQIMAQDAPPPSGTSRVQLLEGNEYVRIWINRGGAHYLIHLPTTSSDRR